MKVSYLHGKQSLRLNCFPWQRIFFFKLKYGFFNFITDKKYFFLILFYKTNINHFSLKNLKLNIGKMLKSKSCNLEMELEVAIIILGSQLPVFRHDVSGLIMTFFPDSCLIVSKSLLSLLIGTNLGNYLFDFCIKCFNSLRRL